MTNPPIKTPLNQEQLEVLKRERQMNQPEYSAPTPSRKSGGIIQYLIIAGISLVVCFVLAYSGTLPNLVKVGDYNTQMSGYQATLTTLSTNLANLQNSVTKTIDDKVATITSSYNAKIASAQAQVDNMANVVKSLTEKVEQYKATLDTSNTNYSEINNRISSFTSQITDINTKIQAMNTSLATAMANDTALAVRVKAIEDKLNATPTPTTSGGVIIPNVTMTVSTTDEGTIQTDNSTVGEIKLTLVNSGTKNISDIVISVYLSFGDCNSANQIIMSSTYGTWSVRNRQTDEIEIRGKIATLSAGQTRRIYIDVKSFGVPYQTNGSTQGARYVTVLSVSSNDIEVVDWNYTN